MSGKSFKIDRIGFSSKNQKIIASMLVAVLLLASASVLYQLSKPLVPLVKATVFSEPQLLDSSLSPTTVSLHPGGSQLFTLTLRNGSLPISVEWIINGTQVQTDYLTKTNSSIPLNATFKYICSTATQDVEVLQVRVVDVQGRSDSQSAVIYDPATLPGVYLDDTTASASYIIKTDGLGWYWGVNGSTGQIPAGWTSTDAWVPIQLALSAASSSESTVNAGGGIVFVRAGVYTISQSLHVYAPAILQGEGMGNYYNQSATTLKLADNSNCDLIVVDSLTSHDYFGAIKDITLDGNAEHQRTDSSNGIVIQNSGNGVHSDFRVTNTFVINCAGTGIKVTAGYYQHIEYNYVEGCITGIYLGPNTFSNWIESNVVKQNFGDGIQINLGNSHWITNNEVRENYLNGINITLNQWSTLTGNIIQNNGVYPPNSASDLLLWSDQNITVTGGNIIGSQYFPSETTEKYALYIKWCSNILVTGNTFSNGLTSTFQIDGSDGLEKIFGNQNLVTENSFSGKSRTKTTAVLNHELCATPTFVSVSFSTSAITGYTWTATSTQVTITVAGTNLPASWTCYVYAIYKP